MMFEQRGGEAMITKIRTNIFLTRVQLKKLKALARKNRASVAALVRIAIDDYLKKGQRKA
jgi:lipopolysaccharide biosynthesis glycosyltransferase